MKALKNATPKRTAKSEREHRVLIGLVDFYLKTGKPVGSNTLKEAGFEDLSSATIRNYFASLEADGYLVQQHSSGGRIPTYLAYQVFAKEYENSTHISKQHAKRLSTLREIDTREIAAYLQDAAELLSELTQTAVFLSAPRFDNDYIIDLKLVPIDQRRCLCVIVTDFGVIQTELLPTEGKLTTLMTKKMEAYFQWRLTGFNKPELDPIEELTGQKMYNELIIRYIVNYSNFHDEELYRTGFSKLLAYPEFHESKVLGSSLGLFENSQTIKLLLKECCKLNRLKYWIGNELDHYSTSPTDCTIVAMPYHIKQNIAGVVGILGPTRIPYAEVFGLIKEFSRCISEALTKNLYKHKITYRQPHSPPQEIEKGGYKLLLLEDLPPSL